jgi:hypothetical protein
MLPLDWEPPKKYLYLDPPDGYAVLAAGTGEYMLEDLITGKVIYDPDLSETDMPPGYCFPPGTGFQYLRSVLYSKTLPEGRYINRLRNSFLTTNRAFPYTSTLTYHFAALAGSLGGNTVAQPEWLNGSSSLQVEFNDVRGGGRAQTDAKKFLKVVPPGTIVWSNVQQIKQPDGRYRLFIKWENFSPTLIVTLEPAGYQLTTAYMGVVEIAAGTGTTHCGQFGGTCSFKDVDLRLDDDSRPDGADWNEQTQKPAYCNGTTTLVKKNPGGSVIYRFQNKACP